MLGMDRRSFLVRSGLAGYGLIGCGLAGGGLVTLASCSDDDASDSAIRTSDDGFALAKRFSAEVIVPGTPRLPFSLANDQALMSDGPEVLRGEIRDADGAVVIPSISAQRRRVSDALSYWDFRPTLETVGIYYLVIDGGTPDGGAFQINDPATVKIPFVGQPLPAFDTPTTSDGRGVDPICTRVAGGPCPFHKVTLTEALATGKPVAYLIGTPAHCQFGTCAPGLEFLIAASDRIGDDLVVVHAEVYADDSATVAAPAMGAYNLVFEPTIFLADRTGTVVQRLDAAWDATELDEELDRLLA